MRRVASLLLAIFLLVLSVASFPMFPFRVHATTTSNILWHDDFESYPLCGFFPSNPLPGEPWVLRFSGANYGFSQYVDCSTAYQGGKSLHLQGQDVTTTGVRWSAVAARSFSLDGANTIGYDVFVKTGLLHSAGTNEVACDTSFEVRATVWGVYPALVEFTDNGRILPGNLSYTPQTWYEVKVSVNLFENTFDLQINGAIVGTFEADPEGDGSFLSSISGLALMSNHAGRECWFDNVTVESTNLVQNGDFSGGLTGWYTVKVHPDNLNGGYPIFEVLIGPPGGASSA